MKRKMLAEIEYEQQIGVTIPGWPCPYCPTNHRSQVARNAHIKKQHYKYTRAGREK